LQPIYDIIVDLMCTGESLSTSQAKEIARLMPQCAASVRHIGFGG
jgi:ATP phosphoribosyltransferase